MIKLCLDVWPNFFYKIYISGSLFLSIVLSLSSPTSVLSEYCSLYVPDDFEIFYS